MHTTSADGTEIAWYDFGGTGADLLLAHATGFCGEIWAPIAQHLVNDFHCVSYDLRGHGKSASPANPNRNGAFDWQRYADDAIAVIDAAGLQNPFGVGHSCGGATELLIEERNPSTFKALYLFEPVIFTDDPPLGPDEERDLAVRTRKRRTSFVSRNAAIEAFGTKGPFVTLAPEALAKYVDCGFEVQPDGSLNLRCNAYDEAEVYVMASAHDGFQRLDAVNCPTTIIHGSESTSFTEAHMKTVASRIPNCNFVQWEGMGHFGPLEQPAEFAAAIRNQFVTPTQ